MDDRLIAIEERMAHLERMLDDASAEILRQSRLINGLDRRIQRLEIRLAQLAGGIDDGPEPGAPFMP